MMKSIVYDNYGGPEVLKLLRTSVPEPTSKEVLIKVISSSVTAADWHLRKADPFMVRLMNGVFKPKKNVLGQEFFGEIIQTGSEVTKYQNGDMVFGSTGMKTGSNSEYIILEEDSVMTKSPAGFEKGELSVVPTGAMTAYYFLSQANLKSGDKVLINGASGSVGTYAIQIARSNNAEVIGVCSTSNVELVQHLGADKVIDYKNESFSDKEDTYDIIFDTVGNLNFKQIEKNLKPEGYFISTAFNSGLMISMIMNGFRKGKKVFTGVTKETKELLESIKSMLINETLIPVIDQSYSMEEIRDAHQYAESGRKRGNLLLIVDGGYSHV